MTQSFCQIRLKSLNASAARGPSNTVLSFAHESRRNVGLNSFVSPQKWKEI